MEGERSAATVSVILFLVVVSLGFFSILGFSYDVDDGSGVGSVRIVFQVDKGFVAQVAAVVGGRSAPMNEEQKQEAEKTVTGEFSSVKHVRGILSMGRHSDPDSGSSSFSILLGDAPHLDGQYAVFGRLTKGDDTLKKLEELPTRQEGIFVMPTEHITILSSYYYDTKLEICEKEKSVLKRRLYQSAIEVERQRMKCLPG